MVELSSKQTLLVLQNGTAKDVEVYLTLGATPGCVQNVSDIPFVKKKISSLQGSFILKGRNFVSYLSPKGVGINGNFSFGSPPLNCASPAFPSGVNLAEFILNNAFQGSGAQETLDISGVAGTNCILRFEMEGGGIWNAGSSYPDVKYFENASIGKNAGLVGVYPYACDGCTKSISPPICSTIPVGAPQPIILQKEAICNVQRDASEFGGQVLIVFKGFVNKLAE